MPWLQQHRPGARLFFCDPPGHTAPDHIFHLNQNNVTADDYVFFHDQEPVDIELYSSLFDEVVFRNMGIVVTRSSTGRLLNTPDVHWNHPDDHDDFAKWRKDNRTNSPDTYFRTRPDKFVNFLHSNPALFQAHVVVSERGDNVKFLCDFYGWKSHYYFYHGWACLDWFRGYDRTFLIPRAKVRTPTKTFMSPNRIVAGKRDHRVLFLYHILKQGLQNNHISAPRTCPVEGVNIVSIAQKYTNVYQDIVEVFEKADLPRTFTGEETQQMTSCWLTNFAEAADSLIYVPTETVYFGRRNHITEKTFKAIALEMPFVLVAPAGSLAYLREYGFKTFDSVFDESYDLETNDLLRVEKVTALLKSLDQMSTGQRLEIHQACLPIVEYNYNHFYRGGFADVLWQELTGMLEGIRV